MGHDESIVRYANAEAPREFWVDNAITDLPDEELEREKSA